MASHVLFDDVLLETTRGDRRRRKLTLCATLAGEALAIAAVIAVPLLYLDAVPGYPARASTLALPLAPAPAGESPARDPEHGQRGARNIAPAPPTHSLVDPLLPYGHPHASSGDIGDGGANGPNPPWGCPGCVPGGTGTHLIAAVPIPPAPQRRIISHVDAGMILHRVEPLYPAPAKQVHVQGEVVLRAIIGKDGRIQGLQVVSGHPLLASAARDAVSQWRFRPYQLNGSPVEVEAQITVRFVLSGR